MNSPGKTGEKEAPLEQRHGIALWTQWTVSPGVQEWPGGAQEMSTHRSWHSYSEGSGKHIKE